MSSSSSLGLTCPSGGTFYVCQHSKVEFLGCCTTDPCADGSGSCPEDDLRVASFSSDAYIDVPAQQCADSRAEWYTCKLLSPPFLGCCSADPCTLGACPAGDLYAAELSGIDASRSIFTATASATAGSSSRGASSLSGGAIAGIVVGAVAGVLAIVAACLFLLHRRRRGSAGEGKEGVRSTEFPGWPAAHDENSKHEAYKDAGDSNPMAQPPGYAPSPSSAKMSQQFRESMLSSISSQGTHLSPQAFEIDSNHARMPGASPLLGTVAELGSHEAARHELAADR